MIETEHEYGMVKESISRNLFTKNRILYSIFDNIMDKLVTILDCTGNELTIITDLLLL